MLIRTLAAIGLISTLATPTVAAATFVQATTRDGLATVIVNLQNGNIFACPNFSTSATGVPLDDCAKIGAIGVAGVGDVASNIQIVDSSPPIGQDRSLGINVAITNLTNGHVQLCSLLLTIANNDPTQPPIATGFVGSCEKGRAF